MVGRLEDPGGGDVGDDDLTIEGDDRVTGPPGGDEEAIEQQSLRCRGQFLQAARDLPGRIEHDGQHELVGVLVPARQVQDALEPAGDRVDERGAHAGQRLEHLVEVLTAGDHHRAAELDHRAERVRAHHVLAVESTGHGHHPVEGRVQVPLPHPTSEDAGLRVGDDDARDRSRQLLGQAVQHRTHHVEEPGAALARVIHGHRGQAVGGHTAQLRAAPRVGDLGPDGPGDGFFQEAFTSGSDLLVFRHQRCPPRARP